ncbi:MAG: hypothetical protein U5R06_21195 [candidate division KSB1 bacterium]|nr:hypothetical protein [candidate division KSB1 bacterium]
MKFYSILVLFALVQLCRGGALEQLTIDQTIQKLEKKYGDQHRFRIEKGVQQVAQLWRTSDGSQQAFQSFCTASFIADSQELDRTLDRFQHNLEIIYGHMHQVNRDLSVPVECETNYLLPVDHRFAEYDPSAHIQSDLFTNKIAFTALLNFPAFTLAEKNKWAAIGHGGNGPKPDWRMNFSCASRLTSHRNGHAFMCR